MTLPLIQASPTTRSPIVSTWWLAENIHTPEIVVLDATVLTATGPFPGFVTGHERFLVNGHIPGARFADLLETFSDPEGQWPFTKPTEQQFSDAVGALGIDNDTNVVVYDSEFGQWAARIWWLFRAFGHDKVTVLDGGLTKWLGEGRATESGHAETPRAHFTTTPHPEFWADKSDVEQAVCGSTDSVLICGLPPREFSGELSPRARAGHIPGSLSVPVSRLVDRETRALLPAEQLRELLGQALGRRVIAYCAGGIAATADALALAVLGEYQVSVYDGSLNEWVADPEAALVTVT